MRKIICPININTKAKATKYLGGIHSTLMCVATVRGWQFTPLIKGVGLKKRYETRGFRQATPLIKGVNLRTLNYLVNLFLTN